MTRLLRAVLSSLIALSLLTATGCWDQREINQLAIILGMGIDAYGDDRMLVSVQMSVPTASSGSQQSGEAGGAGRARFALVQGTGLTPFDALRALTLTVNRVPFLSHLRVLIVGRTLAERGLASILDFMGRDPSPRGTVWMTVSPDSASDVLAAQTSLGQASSQALDELMRGQANLGQVAAVDLATFTQLLIGDAKAAYAPIVETAPRPGGGSVVRVEGTAIFLGDRMVGALDEKGTRGLLWVRGELKGGSLAVVDPAGKAWATMDITGVRTHIKPYFSDGKPQVDVNVTVDATLSAFAGADQPDSQSTLAALAGAGAETIKAEIAAALTGARAARADVFGFAAAFHRAYRRQWRQLADRWPEEFAGLEVNVDAKVRLSRVGLLLKRPPVNH